MAESASTIPFTSSGYLDVKPAHEYPACDAPAKTYGGEIAAPFSSYEDMKILNRLICAYA